MDFSLGINARLADGAKASWELGTRLQAILALSAPAYSVLTPHTPLPPPPSIPDPLSAPLAPFFSITRSVVANRTQSNANATGAQPLIQDGSAADPASIGFAVLLANWTGQAQRDGLDYAGAARDQLDFLLNKVPRTGDGAISHRVSQVQLWSDFVYMVPPFLAYYGVITQNRSLLVQAHDQIRLYRSYLRDPSANNLWKHVLLGTSGNDEGHWSTGNAWAAAGMLRVLGTLRSSPYAPTLKAQQSDLASWVSEIHSAMYPHLDPASSLFPNYASQPPGAPGNFLDAASTALLAATVYRLAMLRGTHTYLPAAERCRRALYAASSSSPSSSSSASSSSSSNSTASGLEHFDPDGWLAPVVNPHAYREQGSQSPEAQAFVVEMQAAWRDWVADGSKGANAAARGMRGGVRWVAVVVGVAVVGVGMGVGVLF
ncbi:putative glycosyl hydrolase family 88 [Lyophyllum shimeji]|uniref:Glycosyl hydrolase family 88 n=1 Tax=Lyophyllum shimeji TaxID=47721 RepID=A0A9P3UPQ6_LYOSH|nr:putative glycosyl hydrolase family 88 [Lyophyllum shimeji]